MVDMPYNQTKTIRPSKMSTKDGCLLRNREPNPFSQRSQRLRLANDFYGVKQDHFCN